MSTRLASFGRRAAVLICGYAAACAPSPPAELMHLADMPAFEGGRVLEDCELSPEDRQSMEGWERRCIVVSQQEAGGRMAAYAQSWRARGWTQGGAAGSGMWVLIPMGPDCAQAHGVVASDYPRESQTTATSEVVLDFILEQRLRCGDERNLP